MGMRPLAAHCHLRLGKLYRHIGKSKNQAHQRLSIATTAYREVDIRFWLKQGAERVADMRLRRTTTSS